MTVICIATLDKFSRFYLDIGRELNQYKKTNLKIYSLHLSGFLYTLFRFKLSSWITFRAYLLSLVRKKTYANIIKNTQVYKGIAYNKYTRYHKVLLQDNEYITLKCQALAYIDIFDSVFSTKKIDYLICIGDAKLSIEIAIAVAKLHNVTIRYIEQGPFGTTFFDTEGVNANLSLRNNFETQPSNGATKGFNLAKKTPQKYARSPFYRAADVLLISLFETTKLYPPDLKLTDINPIKAKSKKTTIVQPNAEDFIFLLILQVPFDVNFICHSPWYKSHTEILFSVYKNLPKNTRLIVREHPLFVNKYESSMYDFIDRSSISIDSKTPLHKALNSCNVVIVNNSTVGIEAIVKQKTVVVLGNAFYDNASICLKLNDKSQLAGILERALTYTPDSDRILYFMHLLLNRTLVDGNITDNTLKSSKIIAKKLLEHEQK